MPHGPSDPRRVSRLAALVLPALLGACAAMPSEPPPFEIPDPYEGMNRSVTSFNTGVNRYVVRPVAGLYQAVPPQVRRGVSNGTSNLNEPVVFVNDLLQGRGRAAEITFGRFLFNTTLGLGGLFDVAALGGLPKQTGDFGQTLYVWGVRDQNYLVLPVLGPSNPRDAVGFGVDSAASPAFIAIGQYSRTATYVLGAVGNLDRTGELRDVEETSLDPYVRLKSLYWQTRRAELLEGAGIADAPPPTPEAIATRDPTPNPRRGVRRVAPLAVPPAR